MALFKEVKCERCDRRYSAIRAKCPHCGAKKNTDGKDDAEGVSKLPIIIYAIVLIAVVAAVVILVCSAIRGKNGDLSGAKNTPPVRSPGSGVSSVDGTDPTPSQNPDGGGAATTTPEPSPEATPDPETTVYSITLSLTDFTLFKAGEQWTIEATLSPAGSKAEIKWISENPAVATVDENGTVTAVKGGNTIVSATAGGVTAECIVRVSASVTGSGSGSSGSTSQEGSSGSSKLSHSDVTIDSAISERFSLTVKNAPAGGKVSYSVDNAGVATVDASGLVTAVSKGTANVTVTITSDSGTETLKCIVRVR